MSIPLGAKTSKKGVHFSVFSAHAERIELCLFEKSENKDIIGGFKEFHRVDLQVDSFGVWSTEVIDGEVSEIGPGTAYGYRAHGRFAPKEGSFFNPHKLLFCPYAQSVARQGAWHDSLRTASVNPDGSYLCIEQDSAPYAPLAAVAEPLEPYLGVRPRIPREELVIYELHVKGMTALHPLVPEDLRGTYLGLAQPEVVRYLKGLGVTAIELLPIHFHFDEPHLAVKGLTNYWGYNTLGFFAPEPRYASRSHSMAPTEEFRVLVKTFHEAGIEVILDVVFNHSCEGGPSGPTVSFRGFDNSTYYRLDSRSRDRYIDYTGCGNSLDSRHPRVVELIIASLRYWVEIMGVDGFRFDLTPVLGRGRFDMDPEHGLFQAIAQDRILSSTKLLAEPWDMGTYQLGHFLSPWMEWNGQYRDTVRTFWSGEPRTAARLATRLAGSSDLFGVSNKGPLAGINFITCHDGFTLRDLVSYEKKHNEANGEANRDGNNDNRSWNCGEEGETQDKKILALRLRQQKNFLLTLCLSTGVPMILGGDEISRTQHGNNNGYCQDNSAFWINWAEINPSLDLREFIQELLKIRAANPTLRRSTFFNGINVEGEVDLSWWSYDGKLIEAADWDENSIDSFAALYGSTQVDSKKELLQSNRLYLCLNPTVANQKFTLHKSIRGYKWEVAVATCDRAPAIVKHCVTVQAHGAVLLQSTKFR